MALKMLTNIYKTKSLPFDFVRVLPEFKIINSFLTQNIIPLVAATIIGNIKSLQVHVQNKKLMKFVCILKKMVALCRHERGNSMVLNNLSLWILFHKFFKMNITCLSHQQIMRLFFKWQHYTLQSRVKLSYCFTSKSSILYS